MRACVACLIAPSFFNSCSPRPLARTEEWEKKVADLEAQIAAMQVAAQQQEAIKLQSEFNLTQQIINLRNEKDIAVAAKVGELMADQAEGRAAAFRDGMAYAKEFFKEARAIA